MGDLGSSSELRSRVTTARAYEAPVSAKTAVRTTPLWRNWKKTFSGGTRGYVTAKSIMPAGVLSSIGWTCTYATSPQRSSTVGRRV